MRPSTRGRARWADPRHPELPWLTSNELKCMKCVYLAAVTRQAPPAGGQPSLAGALRRMRGQTVGVPAKHREIRPFRPARPPFSCPTLSLLNHRLAPRVAAASPRPVVTGQPCGHRALAKIRSVSRPDPAQADSGSRWREVHHGPSPRRQNRPGRTADLSSAGRKTRITGYLPQVARQASREATATRTGDAARAFPPPRPSAGGVAL